MKIKRWVNIVQEPRNAEFMAFLGPFLSQIFLINVNSISLGEEKYTQILSSAFALIFEYQLPKARKFLFPANCLAYLSPADAQP